MKATTEQIIIIYVKYMRSTLFLRHPVEIVHTVKYNACTMEMKYKIIYDILRSLHYKNLEGMAEDSHIETLRLAHN